MSRGRLTLCALGSLLLSTGLLAGLGVGSAAAGHASSHATSTTTATVPEPVVTTVTETPATTVTPPGAGKPWVRLGNMNTPEQFIIGELYAVALTYQGYKVIGPYRDTGAVQGVGGIANTRLNLYPEYIGVWNSSEAHIHRRFTTLQASYRAAVRFASRHGFSLLPPTPFSDTTCLAVLAQYAVDNRVRSIAQLAREGPKIIGAPVGNVGFVMSPIERAYHLRPGYVQKITPGREYWWLRSGNVDAAYCATTDPLLVQSRYVVLRDPEHVFGFGNVVPVTTPLALGREGPAFARTIERVDALLTLPAMRGLNAEYQLGGHDPKVIATQFLQGNGLLPPARYAPVTTGASTTAAPSSS